MKQETAAASSQPVRISADPEIGLTKEQVAQRFQEGWVNQEVEIKTKSIPRIVRDNLITPFNILNLILGVLVISVGSLQNALFLGVMFFNTIIGIFQEIRAKQIIDKLSLIAAPKAHVIRDGQKQDLDIHSIVLDDILALSSGQQICSDAIVCQGECEVNEALITGESDPVLKRPGDLLLSGSFLVSGHCFARVEHVGAENYAAKISASAKYIKRPNSEIMTSINKIIKWIGISLIPISIALFCKQLLISDQEVSRAIVSTVAALVGMIPEGLVLLTSVVLAVSVIRLSQHKTLVQELYCIEMLARVDTLCLDKTGTITEGTMQVDQLIPLEEPEKAPASYETILSALVTSLPDTNPTFLALKDAYPASCAWTSTHVIPFSSARKWSGVTFEGIGSFVIGAAEFILKEQFHQVQDQIETYSNQGHRVLLLAHFPETLAEKTLPETIIPLALLLISDKIRAEAKKTLEYFAEEGVTLKVISGDNAITVSNIAQKAGLADAANYVDATTLETTEQLEEAAEKYSVFGRVTPHQKLDLVKALKKKGHTVAMTGDGVNDVLALKESDCSVAMASGSDAARTVSQLVLMDSNFASMPLVVREGRRSINNLQRSASLFLVKTIFSTIIAICFIFINRDYPFLPIQFTLINAFTIGAPSFLLALEPNKERVQGRFVTNVLMKAVPGAITMSANVLLVMAISMYIPFSVEQLSTLCVLATSFTGLLVLFRVCWPLNWVRGGLFCVLSAALIAALFLGMYVLPTELLSLVPLTKSMVWSLLPLLGLDIVLMLVLPFFVDKVLIRLVDFLTNKITAWKHARKQTAKQK